MGYPLVLDVEKTNSIDTAPVLNVDSIDALIPADMETGELLLMFVINDEAQSTDPSIVTPTGWQELIRLGSGSNDIRIVIFGRISDGTEGGTTVLVEAASTPGDTFLAWVQRISDWSGDLDDLIFSTPTDPAASGSTAVAAGLTTLANESLVFAIAAGDGGDMEPTAVSGTGWGTTLTDSDNTSNGISEGGGGGYVIKQVATAGASEDCTFTMGSTDGVAAIQVAVPPLVVGDIRKIKQGSTEISDVQLGGLGIGKVYFGTTVVFNNLAPVNHSSY